MSCGGTSSETSKMGQMGGSYNSPNFAPNNQSGGNALTSLFSKSEEVAQSGGSRRRKRRTRKHSVRKH